MSLIRENTSSVRKQMLINNRREQVRGLVTQEHYNRINTSRKRSYESLTILEYEDMKNEILSLKQEREDMKNETLSLKEVILSMKSEHELAIKDLTCCNDELNHNIKKVKSSMILSMC